MDASLPKQDPCGDSWWALQAQPGALERAAIRVGEAIPHLKKTGHEFVDAEREITRNNFQMLVKTLIHHPHLIDRALNWAVAAQRHPATTVMQATTSEVCTHKTIWQLLAHDHAFKVAFLLDSTMLTKPDIEKMDAYDEDASKNMILGLCGVAKGLVIKPDTPKVVIRRSLEELRDSNGNFIREVQVGKGLDTVGQVDWTLCGPYSYEFDEISARLKAVIHKASGDKVTVGSHYSVTSQMDLLYGWDVRKAGFYHKAAEVILTPFDLYKQKKDGPFKVQFKLMQGSAKPFLDLLAKHQAAWDKSKLALVEASSAAGNMTDYRGTEIAEKKRKLA